MAKHAAKPKKRAAKKSAPKQPPTRQEEAQLDEARRIRLVAIDYRATFEAADAKRRIKTIDAPFLRTMLVTIHATSAAIAEHAAAMTSLESTTADEATARLALFSELAQIRDDVVLVHKETNKPNAREY